MLRLVVASHFYVSHLQPLEMKMGMAVCEAYLLSVPVRFCLFPQRLCPLLSRLLADSAWSVADAGASAADAERSP